MSALYPPLTFEGSPLSGTGGNILGKDILGGMRGGWHSAPIHPPESALEQTTGHPRSPSQSVPR